MPTTTLSYATIPGLNVKCIGLIVDEIFGPFVTDTVLSLVGGAEHMHIKVLCDTAAKCSFILHSVLPFSPATKTGDFILMGVIEIGLVPVLQHKIVFCSEMMLLLVCALHCQLAVWV